MLKRAQVPVCRSFSIQIPQPGGGRIFALFAPREQTSVIKFLERLLPGQKVEHAGRMEMLAVSDHHSGSSLFFQAVHAAFQGHYRLALRPEVLMFLIAHEVAATVKLYPDDYHHLFTTSPDKQVIEVGHNGLMLGDAASPWHEALAMFGPALRAKVPPGIMDHMLPGFSTATPETDAASMIAFMDAASPFYDYEVVSFCGLPEIRLLGTAQDWRKLLQAAAQLAEPFAKHLGLYFRHLLPVLKTLVEQAEGAPMDNAFWSSIYKFESSSGSDVFYGWLSAFVNYVQGRSDTLTQKSVHLFDWKTVGQSRRLEGLRPNSLPSHVSVVPFKWNDRGRELPMTFAGGMLGLDDEDGYMTPALSYAVLHAAK